jgi:hypothetical protein
MFVPCAAKRIRLDDETWQALLISRDSMKTFQGLADEAFADLLEKAWSPDRPQDCTEAERSTDRTGEQRQRDFPRYKNAA